MKRVDEIKITPETKKSDRKCRLDDFLEKPSSDKEEQEHRELTMPTPEEIKELLELDTLADCEQADDGLWNPHETGIMYAARMKYRIDGNSAVFEIDGEVAQ